MNKYVVTYHDEIKANTLEEAQKRLLVVLKSDIEYEDLGAFKFTKEERNMTRSELKEWLETCPNKDWFEAADDGAGIRIYFPVNEEEDA